LPQEIEVRVSHANRIPVVDKVCCDAFGQTESIIQATKENDTTVRTLVVGVELRDDRLRGDILEEDGLLRRVGHASGCRFVSWGVETPRTIGFPLAVIQSDE
jgi:hypothetical protein